MVYGGHDIYIYIYIKHSVVNRVINQRSWPLGHHHTRLTRTEPPSGSHKLSGIGEAQKAVRCANLIPQLGSAAPGLNPLYFNQLAVVALDSQHWPQLTEFSALADRPPGRRHPQPARSEAPQAAGVLPRSRGHVRSCEPWGVRYGNGMFWYVDVYTRGYLSTINHHFQ